MLAMDAACMALAIVLMTFLRWKTVRSVGKQGFQCLQYLSAWLLLGCALCVAAYSSGRAIASVSYTHQMSSEFFNFSLWLMDRTPLFGLLFSLLVLVELAVLGTLKFLSSE